MDLGDEKLHLVTRPEPKDPSIFAMRSPIRVEGTFKKPAGHPEAPGPLVARVAAAAALGAHRPAPRGACVRSRPARARTATARKVLAEAQDAGAVKKAS